MGPHWIPPRYTCPALSDGAHHALEPHPTNFELLRRNVAPTRAGAGLQPWSRGGERIVSDVNIRSDQHERAQPGYPDLGTGFLRNGMSRIRNTADFLREEGLARVDLIKIDTEGAEHAILTSFRDVLQKVGWIIGELHDIRDFELLAHLSPWFHVGSTRRKSASVTSVPRREPERWRRRGPTNEHVLCVRPFCSGGQAGAGNQGSL